MAGRRSTVRTVVRLVIMFILTAAAVLGGSSQLVTSLPPL